MRPRLVAMLVTALTVTGGCSDEAGPGSETLTTREPAATTAPASTSRPGDGALESLQDLLAEQGIDESLATFGVEWCRHQDVAMLARDVGGLELAERVAAAAAESAC